MSPALVITVVTRTDQTSRSNQPVQIKVKQPRPNYSDSEVLTRTMEDTVEMSERLAENLLLFIRQNKGRLLNGRRTREFVRPTDSEVEMLEAIVGDAFEGFDEPGAAVGDVSEGE